MDDETKFGVMQAAGAPPVAGGLDALNADPAGARSMRTVMDEQRKLANDRAAYYDRMAKQLEERRFGPAAGDELIELGAAMMAPRSVRGFSGAMGNILPVLQRQSQARREGEQSRAEALNALQMATMQGRESALGQELATMLEIEKLTAAAGKRRTALDTFGNLRNLDTGEIIGGNARLPPPPAIGEVRDGYEFLGGDPKEPTSYRKVQ